MPEGDTVFLAATRLNAALSGKTLVKTDFRVPSIATIDLSGKVVSEVVPRGKHLLFRIGDDVTLHTHFKMEGSWHLYRPGERWRSPAFQARAILETDDWIAVGFRLAVVDLLARSQESDALGHLGPDPLGEDWDAAKVVRGLLSDPARQIGTALLDQSVMAGPGNVYKCEACFLRGVDPFTPVGSVRDLDALVDLVKKLMDANRTTGNQITTGDTRPGRQRWVYGRGGQPCRRCGTSIAKAEQEGYGGDRITYWCPTCQPAPVPEKTHSETESAS